MTTDGDPGGLRPALYRVNARRPEAKDVTNLRLEPLAGAAMSFRPGQFNMVTAFGVGEVALSISSAPGDGAVEHTVRAVGAVTQALCGTEVGEVVGVRGPFGTSWGLDGLENTDVLVIAGGIGLVALRGALNELVASDRGDRVFAFVGARRPDQIIFTRDLAAWSQAGAHVAVTVDMAGPGWTGEVGLVTSLLDDAGFDPGRAVALVCGPEIMMRFTARKLVDMGVDPGRIRVSMERNMQCGVAWCGHCQVGPLLLCRDGPVVPYDQTVAALMSGRER